MQRPLFLACCVSVVLYGYALAGSAGLYHEVKFGQTLWSIAQAYKVDVATLSRVNQLAGGVYTGQKLFIPGATRHLEVASRCPCGPQVTPPSVAAPPVPLLRSAPTPRVVEAAPQLPMAQRPTLIPPPIAVPLVENFHDGGRLIWPVRGEVTRGFTHQAGQRHDGIDVRAPRGTPIYAAADGEVIFSGWGPSGYGRTVIVQHQGDLVTVYAHTEENYVQVGQRVRQGDRIAAVGMTGRASGYHLHFEVRHKATPLSPHKYLPRAHRVAALASE